MNTLVAKLHRWLLWAVVAAVSLGQLQRVFANQASSPYVHDILVVMWVGVFVFRTFSESKLKKNLLERWSKFWSVVPFWIWAGISWIVVWSIALLGWHWLASGVDWIQLAYLGRWVTNLLFGLAVWEWSHWDTANAKNFSRAWQWWLVLLVAFGWLQYLFLPDLRWLHVLGWDDHLYRLSGTTFDPNFTGLLLVFGWVGAWHWSEHKKWPPELQVPALSSITASVALTYSRASYLSLVGVVATLLLIMALTKKRSSKFAIVTAACVFIGLASLFTAQILIHPDGEGVKLARTASVTARAQSANEILGELREWKLITGRGWFAQRTETTRDETGGTITIDRARLPDNWILWLLQSIGLVGTVPLLMMAGYGAWKAFKTHPHFLALTTSLLIHGMFNASVTQPFVVIAFSLTATFLTLPTKHHS